MIKNISASYAGHIVDSELGLSGTPVNDRKYSNNELSKSFSWALEISKLMDDAGYDEFWMAEHHFQPEGFECIPNLVMLNLWLSTQTTNLKFGCGFNIAPMWHPLRLAEDFATADILSNGRLIFGVGRGYHSREVETFGAPLKNSDDNRELFEEQVEIIIKAFNNDEFSHQGKHYTLPAPVEYRGYTLEKLSLVPRPLSTPVDIWQPLVSGNPKGIDFMAKHNIKALVATTPKDALEERLTMYQDAYARYGKTIELGENIALGFRFFIADTQEKAIEQAKPYFEEAMKFAAPLGLLQLSEEQVSAVANRGGAATIELPTLERQVENETWLCGPPDQIADKILEISEKYPGVSRLNLGSTMGTPLNVYKEQLQLFADKVMPKIKG